VCGLVLLTGAVVLWLAHRSAKASTLAAAGAAVLAAAVLAFALASTVSRPVQSLIGFIRSG
jgi:hypothetical protein